MWIVFSVCLLGWLAWRQGFNADTWGYVPLLAIVAAVKVAVAGLCDPEGLPIRGYGVMILTAVVGRQPGAVASETPRPRSGNALQPGLLAVPARHRRAAGLCRAKLVDQFWVVYLDTRNRPWPS